MAQRVFTDTVYTDLERAFQSFLLSDHRLFTKMPSYDAAGMQLTPDAAGAFSIFLSRPWHDMLATLIGVNATGDVQCSLHHHQVGSDSGTPHNDLNPGWFIDQVDTAEVNVADTQRCNYELAGTHEPGVRVHEVIRAVAVMFYVNNPPWSPGDGGETGLYLSASDPVTSPVTAIPPINNSLICFECTPYSYHSFIANRSHQRNSLTMWLHRPKAEVIERWGEGRIVYW
jgi:hypothetical protein